MESYIIWLFVSSIFHLTSCFQGSFVLQMSWIVIIFYTWIIFHFMNISYFVYPFVSWKTFTLWSPVSYREQPYCEHSYILFFLEHVISIILIIYPGVELWGNRVILCLNFWGNTKLFSTGAEPFYITTSTAHSYQQYHFPFFDYRSSWMQRGISLWFWWSLP